MSVEEKYPYPSKAIEEAKTKFYMPKNLKKGNSWQYCRLEYLEDKLIEEFEEYFEKGNAFELLDIINVASMLFERKVS